MTSASAELQGAEMVPFLSEETLKLNLNFNVQLFIYCAVSDASLHVLLLLSQARECGSPVS